MYEIVSEGEIMRGDGLCDGGDTKEVDNRFSSRIYVLVRECGSSSVRLTTSVGVTIISFLGSDGVLVEINQLS